VLAAGLTMAGGPAQADDGYTELSFTSKSPWMIRVRGIAVIPDESGDLSAGGAPLTGGIKIDDAVVPEVDISYFFTDNIAAELILATAPHDVTATNLGGGGDVDLGDVWLLPPTLTLQYHFFPQTMIKPYIGGGLNYTVFYNEDVPSGGPVNSIDYDDSLGYVLQAGVDVAISENWSLNLDVKKLFLETDVTVRTGAATINADVDIDPWIIGVGVGYRF
jgi:outer membrane protein